MTCNNPNHHQKNEEPCNVGQNGYCQPFNHHQGPHGPQSPYGSHWSNPHDGHYHINKIAVRVWAMNFAYVALHAVEIYLLVKVL